MLRHSRPKNHDRVSRAPSPNVARILTTPMYPHLISGNPGNACNFVLVNPHLLYILLLFNLIVPHYNKWRIPEMMSLRGSYFVWETSALVLPFMPLRVLTTDSSYSILVLNHDWQPDKRYDLWDSWVGKIIDIRGNSPQNVRSSSLSGYSCSLASPKDLGNYTMVLLRG